MGVVRVGTSGFSYPSWRGGIYPEKLSGPKMLAHYTQAMDCVEMHAAYRRLPEPHVADRWRESASGDFRFAIKAPQVITHHRRLADTAEPVASFCEFASRLGPLLGPLLFQLPHNFLPNPQLLADFVASLPSGFDHIVEPRSQKWINDEVDAVLESAGIGRSISDDLSPITGQPPGSGAVAYVRLRKDAYSRGELKAIAAWALDVAATQDVYLIVRHSDEPGAMRPAMALKKMVGGKKVDPPN